MVPVFLMSETNAIGFQLSESDLVVSPNLSIHVNWNESGSHL